VLSVVPPPKRPGDRPSFYSPRGGSLQACPTVLTTCGGVAYSVVELMVVLENLASVRHHGVPCSRPRAASRVSCGDSPFGRRPRADSRVRLTDGRRAHSSRHGDVLSSHVLTASGWVLQCPGWQHSDRDGRIGLEVTVETHSTGLMSWRHSAQAWEKCLYLFRGLFRPLSRVRRAGRTGAGSTVSRS
jgi:hypothetical protein